MFNDHHDTKTVERQVLYEQVWAQPMTKVAKEYGISNVALAKICKKLNIPYPWRGYWRRKETGKAVKQLPLPPNLDPTKQAVTIQPTIWAEAVAQLSEDIIQRIHAEQTSEQKIEVPNRITNLHRLLKGHLTEWRSPKVDEYGAIWSEDIRRLNIRVSPKSLSRAWRIINTLFHALDARGYPAGIQNGYKQSLGVRINGEPIEFSLEEKFRRIDRPDQKNSRLQFLKITESWADGLQKTWSDGKTAKLETCLNDFIVGLLRVAEAVRARRLKQEQEHHARLQAEQQREEEARKRQALEQEATRWAKAQQIRVYLAALKDMLMAKHGEIQSGSHADQWLAWAHQHADRLDPLISG